MNARKLIQQIAIKYFNNIYLLKICKLRLLVFFILKIIKKMLLIKLTIMKILSEKVKTKSFGKFNKNKNTAVIS